MYVVIGDDGYDVIIGCVLLLLLLFVCLLLILLLSLLFVRRCGLRVVVGDVTVVVLVVCVLLLLLCVSLLLLKPSVLAFLLFGWCCLCVGVGADIVGVLGGCVLMVVCRR